MNFMNPSAFWGLIGLVVPLLVLLLSKKKQDIVEFGSLAFLEVSESQNAKALFPTEWLLFFLRVALVVMAVLLLAKPVFQATVKSNAIYVEQELADDPTFSETMAGLSESSEIKLFGFDASVSDDFTYFPSGWTFIRTLNNNRDSATVYSYSYQKNFIGKAVPLRHEVTWKTWPQKAPLIVNKALKIEGQDVGLEMQSDENGLRWQAEKLTEGASDPVPTVVVTVIASQSSLALTHRIKAMLNALSEVIPVTFDFEEPEKGQGWLISVDTLVDATNLPLIQWDSEEEGLSLTQLSEEYYHVIGDLSSEQLVGSNVPLAFAEIFLARALALEKMDRRVVEIPTVEEAAENKLLEARTEERKYYWWGLALIVVLVERLFAYKSKVA